MKENLLVTLSQYPPTQKKMPLENFLTEAFAWILKNNPEFSVFFIEKITRKLNLTPELNIEQYEWSTQVDFNGKHPDMLCEIDTRTEQVAFIFEHKIWANLHSNQLSNYKRYAKEHYGNNNVFIILISATTAQHLQNPDLALCWLEVYTWVKDWIKENKVSDFIFQDFLNFIKHLGMGPPAPISHHAILSYYPARHLKKQISNLIKIVEKKDWGSIVKMKDLDIYVEDKRGSYYGEGWGRIGLNLFSEWHPSVFVGFLLDGEDHCTTPLSTQSPDFSIILSFKKSLHNKYPNNLNYQNLIKNISDRIGVLNKQWDVYHHIKDTSATRINKWHPLHIRKPMLELFRGTETTEEQVKQFMQAAEEVVTLMLTSKHFEKLRDDFK